MTHLQRFHPGDILYAQNHLSEALRTGARGRIAKESMESGIDDRATGPSWGW